jgi:biopolymer transport protein ExbD
MSKSILRKLELADTDARKARIKGQRSSGLDATINITPLVDVVLVLLIIFMIVTPMLDDGIQLPKSADPKKVNAMSQDLKISVNAQGQIKFGDDAVEKVQLKERLTKELSKNPFRPVYLSADQSLQFSTIRELLTALRDLGVHEAGLMSAKLEGES